MALRRTRGLASFLASFVPAMIVIVVGFAILGGDAPFWQLLLVAVVAGLIGLTVGQVYTRRVGPR